MINLTLNSRKTTPLGYGCSSLMGAMGRSSSLALLESAYDAGIRHFDVAPAYGYGEAESCLGEFLKKHRADVTVTTKYGIPPARKSWIGLARSIARPIVKAVPGIKQKLNRVAVNATKSGSRATFSAAEAKESLERSLRTLNTERIDVWLLHEAEAQDLHDEGLLRLLEDAVAAGTIGSFGVGSDRWKLEPLLQQHPQYCHVIQCEWSVMDAPMRAPGSFRFHHRALTSHFRELHAKLAGDAQLCQVWSSEVGANLADAEVLASLMLKASLMQNPDSVILFSSKNVAHMRHNVAVADDTSLAEPAQRLYGVVQRERLGRNGA